MSGLPGHGTPDGAAGDTGRSSDVAEAEHDLVIPEGGFWPAPAIPQPNIYPMEWRVETAKLAAIYEKSQLTLWNPADLPRGGRRAEDFTPQQRRRGAYWCAGPGDIAA